MRSNVEEIDRDLTAAFAVLRGKFAIPDGTPEDTAMCEIETFCAIALRVFRKTNPSKLRSETRTVELQARLDGIPVIDR